MSEEVCRLIEDVKPGRVFSVEAGGIWFSGMNANVGRLTRRVAQKLQSAGYDVGDIRDEDGGLFLEVDGVEDVSSKATNKIVSPPGGDRGRETELELPEADRYKKWESESEGEDTNP